MKKMKFIILSLLGILYVDNAIACSKSKDWTEAPAYKNHSTVYSCKNGGVLCYYTTDKGPPYVTLNYKAGACQGRKSTENIPGAFSQTSCATFYQQVEKIAHCFSKSSRIVPH